MKRLIAFIRSWFKPQPTFFERHIDMDLHDFAKIQERIRNDIMASFGVPADLINNTCQVPPPGWRCTRRVGHDGPCAAVPV